MAGSVDQLGQIRIFLARLDINPELVFEGLYKIYKEAPDSFEAFFTQASKISLNEVARCLELNRNFFGPIGATWWGRMLAAKTAIDSKAAEFEDQQDAELVSENLQIYREAVLLLVRLVLQPEVVKAEVNQPKTAAEVAASALLFVCFLHGVGVSGDEEGIDALASLLTR